MNNDRNSSYDPEANRIQRLSDRKNRVDSILREKREEDDVRRSFDAWFGQHDDGGRSYE